MHDETHEKQIKHKMLQLTQTPTPKLIEKTKEIKLCLTENVTQIKETGNQLAYAAKEIKMCTA